MNNSDRLREGQFSKDIISRIQEILREHDGLKKIQNDRREEAIRNKLSDDKPLQEVLQRILKNSPVLSKILLAGQRLSSPFGHSTHVGEETAFIGKKHPTYFRIKGKLTDGKLLKKEPINQNFRIQFETDVENDYFARPVEAGRFVLKMNGQPQEELIRRLSLYNGTATLSVSMPSSATVGERYVFETQIIDDYIVPTFDTVFELIVEEAAEPSQGVSGNRTPPRDPSKSGKREEPAGASMPNVQEKHQNEWSDFGMDRYSALVLFTTDESSDYFLNMDNSYLLTELKQIKDESRASLVRARYKYSMTLIGMSVESYCKSNIVNGEGPDIPSEVKRVSTMIAPIIIPMIEAMSELTIEDI